MEREYIYRRPGGPLRRPSRRRGPPWIFWVLLVLAVIVIATVIIVKLAGGKTDEPSQSSSAPASSLASIPQEGQPTAPPDPTAEPSPTAAPQTAPDSEPVTMGSIMVADGVGYDYYKFSEEATNKYITAVSNAGNAITGSTVYSIVIPTSIDVTLPESYLLQYEVDTSDQKKAIDRYIYPSINAMNPNVKTVPVFDALLAHCNENIYFGSDSTWTQLGAYYAYVEFCKTKGIQALGLDQFEKRTYDGFMGGFAAEAGEDALYSDTVEAYHSSANTSLSYLDSDGDLQEGYAVIADGSGYDTSYLYLIFAAGDQSYKVLENADITDGSACVVVQDSFGNFFTPFLTNHYQKVYVVDYRSYSGNVPQLASEVGASDVIIMNHVIMTSTESAVDTFSGLF